LRAGGIVAYPTEAVWGLGCDPADAAAVETLLGLKRRPMHKGLILVAASMRHFDVLLAGLSAAQRARLARSWPGPTTWLVPHRGLAPAWIAGEHDTVALRVSAHPVVAALCNAFGGPLVSTSANVAGKREAKQQYQLRRYFGARLDYVVPGNLGDSARPTAIRDLRNDEIVRPG